MPTWFDYHNRTLLLGKCQTYGGIAAINLWLSGVGFIPNGDETIACSSAFKVYMKQIIIILVSWWPKY